MKFRGGDDRIIHGVNLSEMCKVGRYSLRIKQAMWKVGGIEIELAIGRQSFFGGTATEITEKRNFLLFGPLLRNEEKYWDGP